MSAKLISRTRLLPYHGVVSVQEGDWVQAGDVVAELQYVPGSLSKTQAARQLSIKPAALMSHMHRCVGDRVEEGDLLASSMRFGEARQALSTTSGYIGLVSSSLGTVYIRQSVQVGSKQPVHINLLEELKISKLALIPALRVRPLQMVALGQVLAKAPGAKGQAVQSPVYGRVDSVVDGMITIIPTHASTTLNAYLTGRIQRVIPQQGVEVQAFAHVITGIYGVGAESGGEILLAAKADEELTASAVTEAWKDKIVLAGRTASLELLQAASELGCAGLVVAYISYETLTAYVGSNSRPGMTGEDELLMPVMLTERFSSTAMRASVWQEFSRLQGRYASMSGRTHIRAGLMRPEVVVCEVDWPERLTEDEGVSGTVEVGSLVRILRGKYLDQIGRVVELPNERQQIATGAKLRVGRVDLDGQVVTVSLANLLKLVEGRQT